MLTLTPFLWPLDFPCSWTCSFLLSSSATLSQVPHFLLMKQVAQWTSNKILSVITRLECIWPFASSCLTVARFTWCKIWFFQNLLCPVTTMQKFFLHTSQKIIPLVGHKRHTEEAYYGSVTTNVLPSQHSMCGVKIASQYKCMHSFTWNVWKWSTVLIQLILSYTGVLHASYKHYPFSLGQSSWHDSKCKAKVAARKANRKGGIKFTDACHCILGLTLWTPIDHATLPERMLTVHNEENKQTVSCDQQASRTLEKTGGAGYRQWGSTTIAGKIFWISIF